MCLGKGSEGKEGKLRIIKAKIFIGSWKYVIDIKCWY